MDAWTLFVIHYLYFILAFIIGLFSGVPELISRYKDEPFRALFSPYGLIYLGTNGGLAVVAYGLLRRYDLI